MSKDAPLIALAAGGTGGHMFPAEALALEMKQRGWRVLLFTDERGLRFGSDFPADITCKLNAANPNKKGAKIAVAFALFGGMMTARKMLSKHKPDIVVGFGGYPSAPAMMAARLKKLPYGVHEQNAVLGRVNRAVARQARFVAHGFQQLSKVPTLNGTQLMLGNPVRAPIADKRGAAYVPPAGFSQLSLFVFGGSQGASLFSRVVPAAIDKLPDDLRRRLKVTQQVREEEREDVQARYDNAGVDVELAPFFRNMPDLLVNAHLIIGRAGASTVTEIATIGRPSILVPLRIAMDDHQTGNAQVLVKAGAAELIPEPEFTAEKLMPVLEKLLTKPTDLAQMADAARNVAPQTPTKRLADLVEQTAAMGA